MKNRPQSTGIDKLKEKTLNQFKSTCGLCDGIEYRLEGENDLWRLIGTRVADDQVQSVKFGLGKKYGSSRKFKS